LKQLIDDPEHHGVRAYSERDGPNDRGGVPDRSANAAHD
jgi:hypothetical protein